MEECNLQTTFSLYILNILSCFNTVTYLSTTIDGLAKPNVFLLLGASVPVLLWDALGVGVDAGLASRKVAVGLDGIHGAALVGVDPVETYRGRKQHR